jgi:Zn-dependent protease with chaperone function
VNFGLVLVGLALLAFPGLAAARSRRCPAHEWARVTAWAIGLGATSVVAGLVMTALPPVLHSVQLEGLLAVCDPVVHSLMLGGPIVGWAAVVLTVAGVAGSAAALLSNRRAVRRARIEPYLGRHIAADDHELVVIPTPALVAFSVPGSPPQIVVSEGMVDELDPQRLDAVIGHELAHQRLGHRRYLIVVGIVERTMGFLPFVRRSTEAARESLELWADDVAVESRPATREALRGALVAVASVGAPSVHVSTAVQLRTRRLTETVGCSHVARRGLTYLPAGALACCAAAFVAGWMLSSHQMMALGGYC